MKKEQHHEFVPKKECKGYLQKTEKLIHLLVKNLRLNGINSRYYIIGSAGKRNLITRLVSDRQKNPIDVDINLEIDLSSLSKKYKNLEYLKEFIRIELNKIIKEQKENFSDGQNSSSVLTYIIRNDKGIVVFSFDIAIVSRNKNDEIQRLKLNKKNNLYTWNVVFGSSDLEEKSRLIKNSVDWNKLRTTYLNFKNKYIGDENHPSYVCYKMAVEEIYNQKIQSEELDFDGMFQAIGEIEVSRSVEQLNILYQKGFITKPFYEFPKNEQLGTEIVCWYFIDCIKNWEGYKSRGIGRGNSESEAKINAAYDILRFMLYDDEENDTQEKYYCPYCGAEKEYEDEICPVCYDGD